MTGDSRHQIGHQPYPDGLLGDPSEAKDQLRRAIRTRRGARPPRGQADAATAFATVLDDLAQVRDAGCVAAYAARAGEPGTQALIDLLAGRGTQVLLPVLGKGLARDWAAYVPGETLRERAPGRPPEPGGPTLGADAVAQADVVIVPALAVDTSGNRLGQGGGWYDRMLTLVPNGVPVIAVVFPEEVYDAAERPLPTEEHDRPVHAVATTQGVRWLRSVGG